MKPYELPSDDQAPIRQQAAALAEFASYEPDGALYVMRERPEVFENAVRRVTCKGIEEAEKFLRQA